MPSAVSKFNATTFFDAKKHALDVDFSSLSCTGKAITGVVIKNGVNGGLRVELLFGDARIESIESPTEEVFAGVLRSIFHDNRRPEFFFQTIGRHHPLSGRQYCGYSSPWMRGTALGKLLIEADVWMKLAASNNKPRNKGQEFTAWDGLKTVHDFESVRRSASILLKCKKAEYHETETKISFPTDPVMKIENGVSPEFGDYLTGVLDNFVHDGVSVFEQIRELPKMIVIAEWLKKKGVEIDEDWLRRKTQPSPSAAPETFQGPKPSKAVDSEERSLVKADKKMEQLRCAMGRSAYEAGDVIVTSFGPFRRKIDFKFSNTTTNGSRCVADVVETHYIAGVEQPVFQREMTVRGSDCDEDIDWLYEGLDPRIPINAGFVFPDVKSWSELLEQSVEPFWTIRMGENAYSAYSGGCSMQFPTERVSTKTRQPYCPSPSPSEPPSGSCPKGGVVGGTSDSVRIGGRASQGGGGSASFHDPTGGTVYSGRSMRFTARSKGEGAQKVIAWGSMPSSNFVNGYCAVCDQYLTLREAAIPHCKHGCHKKCFEDWIEAGEDYCRKCKKSLSPVGRPA